MDWSDGTFFNGSADELRLWKTALSSSEVSDLYSFENSVSALSIYGESTTTSASHVSKNGAIGSGSGLDANGQIKN